jgi:hypothetical protein
MLSRDCGLQCCFRSFWHEAAYPECPLSRWLLEAKRTCQQHRESDVHDPGQTSLARLIDRLLLWSLISSSLNDSEGRLKLSLLVAVCRYQLAAIAAAFPNIVAQRVR